MTDINEGRGWPMADEPAPFELAPHRVLLFNLIEGALRSEAGVRRRQANREKTDYYAGRRAGYVCSAACLMADLYGGDYDAGKTALSEALRVASAGFTVGDLTDPIAARALAKTIAEQALRVI